MNRITSELLDKWGACHGGREWFRSTFTGGATYIETQLALHKAGRRDWSNWLSGRAIENMGADAVALECALSDALIAELLQSQDDASSLAASGNASRLAASGENSVVACAGLRATVTLGKGGCASIAYWDGSRVRFATAYEGENGIRAGIVYRVDASGQFVEVK